MLTIHTNYSVGRHGRRNSCWYEFAPIELEDGSRELARRGTESGDLVLELGAGSCSLVVDPVLQPQSMPLSI